MIRRVLLSVMLPLVAVSMAMPAVADPDRPVTTPTRDVDVTYRAGEGDKAVIQRSRWSAGGQKMRLDTPTPGVYVIVDYAARTLAMVSDRDHGVLDLPAPPGAMPGQAVPSSTAFTRRGDSKVAGLSCSEWETTDTQGQATLACFTDDGVLLEARHGEQVLVQATRVAYGTLDASAFVVPQSYSHEAPKGSR